MSENYEIVFSRILKKGKECHEHSSNLMGTVREKVDGQLYSGQGYGEIDFYQQNLSNIYWAKLKVSKSGKKTVVDYVITNKQFPKKLEKTIQLYATNEVVQCHFF